MTKRTPKLASSKENEALQRKFDQLRINFDENFAICPVNFSKPNLDKLQTVYLVYEMGKFPFFLSNNSEIVKTSRVGYKAFKKMLSLKKKNISQDQLRSETMINVSPVDFQTGITETIPNPEDNGQSLSFITEDWQITSHLNYGLPNENDGLVWNYLEQIAAQMYNSKKQFYTVYLIKITDIEQYLIDKGYYKHRDGKLYSQIVDSLQRLKLTVYSHRNGIYRKDTNSFILNNEYSFSLISSLYFKGDKLPDGSICEFLAVAFDPLMLLNFKNNRFLLGLNHIRSKMLAYSSVSLLDRLTLLTYQSFRSKDFFYAFQYKVPFFVLIKYQNLCSFLGFKPLNKNNLKRSVIKDQFRKIFDELKTNEVVQEVLIDQFNNQQGESCFNLFFVLNDSFVQNVLQQGGNELKVLEEQAQNLYKNAENSNAYFRKVMGLVHSQEMKDELFSQKYTETRNGAKRLGEA